MGVGDRGPQAKAAGALALALLVGAGCVDPPAQPQVSVTIRGIPATGNTTTGTNARSLPGEDDVSIALFFHHAPDDAGADASPPADAAASVDAGWDRSTEERRVFSWRHTEDETHVVQLPERDYDSVRAEVTDAIECPDAGVPGVEVLGRGSSGPLMPVLHPRLGAVTPVPSPIPVTSVSDPTQCPR